MIRISIEAAPRELQRYAKQIPQAGIKVMRRAARRSEVLMVQRTDTALPYPAIDRGIYREAWTVENIPDGAILFNPAPHAPIIEFGARPFTPPYTVILEWVIRKFKKGVAARVKASQKGETSRGNQFGFRRGRSAKVDRTLVAIAWGVVNKIKRRGLSPRRIMTGGRPQMESFVRDELMALKSIVESGKI